MKKQTKYFITGVFLLTGALFCITLLPMFIKICKINLPIQRYMYAQVEFFILVACSIFYLFSPKYYKYQVLSVLTGILYYIIFAKIYSFIF